jgi:hypothetical protein
MFFSRRWIVVVSLSLVTVASFTFFQLKSSPSHKLETLLDSRQLEQVRAELKQTEFSDSNFYRSFVYRLEILDSMGDVALALDQLTKMAQTVSDSAFVKDLFFDHWLDLKNRMNSGNPSTWTTSLQNLIQVKLPHSIKDSLAIFLKAKAIRDQTVADWNNCIIIYGQEVNSQDDFISQRRKIFLDTLMLAKNNIAIDSILKMNPCYIPILTKMDRVHNKAFRYDELFNPDFNLENPLAGRYIVGDFNSVDASGNCRGSYDIFPIDATLPEFKPLFSQAHKNGFDPYDPKAVRNWFDTLGSEERQKFYEPYWLWQNYLSKVHKYKTEPLNREPEIEIKGRKYCIGQRMCLCEVQNDTILMVAQFVTSSRNVNYPHSALKDFDDQPRYYAPKCLITSRYWDSAVPYDSLDLKRDKMMGFASRHVIKYNGKVDLPNFLHMTPSDEFRGARRYVNGIHEFAVGGSGPAKYMGTPISLGCVRLHDYPSKFVRWWVPKNARFFIAYEYKRYIQRK